MFRCRRLKQARAERARRKIDRAERHALDRATARFWRAYDQCGPSSEKRLASYGYHFGRKTADGVNNLAKALEAIARIEQRRRDSQRINQLTDAGVSSLLRTITEDKCE